MEKSLLKCHVCGKAFNIVPQAGKGVMLRCDNVDGTCIPHESVFGFGDSEKAAAEIARQKYKI